MLGSQTAQSRPETRANASVHIAFRLAHGVGALELTFAAQWPAWTHPCQRFTASLTSRRA
jgi:hypothetical protein